MAQRQTPSCTTTSRSKAGSKHAHSSGTFQSMQGNFPKDRGKHNHEAIFKKKVYFQNSNLQWNLTTELYRKDMSQLYLVKLLPVKVESFG